LHFFLERIPWSTKEEQAVLRNLSHRIKEMIIPGKQECLECINSESDLQRRTWTSVKNFVRNRIIAAKRAASHLLGK